MDLRASDDENRRTAQDPNPYCRSKGQWALLHAGPDMRRVPGDATERVSKFCSNRIERRVLG